VSDDSLNQHSHQQPAATHQQISLWTAKPWWCQPWSILLTGILIIALSWYLLNQLLLTALVAVAVLAWWLFFLVLVPSAYRQGNL
jgi:hypothetical protein